ncbi:hypothetical protein Tco_0612026, partial [Tanacetum coccineum]
MAIMWFDSPRPPDLSFNESFKAAMVVVWFGGGDEGGAWRGGDGVVMVVLIV